MEFQKLTQTTVAEPEVILGSCDYVERVGDFHVEYNNGLHIKEENQNNDFHSHVYVKDEAAAGARIINEHENGNRNNQMNQMEYFIKKTIDDRFEKMENSFKEYVDSKVNVILKSQAEIMAMIDQTINKNAFATCGEVIFPIKTEEKLREVNNEMQLNYNLHIMPKKKQIRKWDAEQMRKAISAVREGVMGILLASKTFGVPSSTLQRAARSDRPISEILEKPLGRPPVFPRELELELVKYIKEMESQFWGLSRNDVRSLAFQLAKRNGIANPFSVVQECAGKDWFYAFLKRHKSEISIRSPGTGTSLDRVKGFNAENVSKFYRLLEEQYEKYKFSPTRVWTVDETAVSVVQSRQPKILMAKGRRQIGCMTSAERGSLITVISCMSAGGAFVPPYFVFPRKIHSPLLMKHAPPGSDSSCHISGWIQIPIFAKWFDHFLKFTNPSKENPVLLILDGNYSHTRNIDVLEKARDNGVIIISLPPHCTHKMQPLDRAFMGPLKTYYNEEIKRFMREQGRNVTQFDVIEIFSKAYLKVQTAQISINGFKCTGIYPFDKNIFKDSDFISEIQTEEENVPIDPVARAMNNFLPSEEPPVASTSSAAMKNSNGPEEPVDSSSNAHWKNFISPNNISPPPKLQQPTSHRGKRSNATVLTTSPYKKSLQESIKNIQKRKKSKETPKRRSEEKKNETCKASKANILERFGRKLAFAELTIR